MSIKNLDEFFAEAARTGITANDILVGMKKKLKEREAMNTKIKQFAEQAGFPSYWLNPPEPERQNGESVKMLEKFAELVIAAERERLAEQFTVDYRAFRFDSNQIVTDVYEYIANGGL